MALSKTDHLWLLLLRTALVFGNFQSSSFCSPGKVLLWCVGSDIVHVTHLQAVCYISSVYPWALQSPTQNITRWNKAGIQVLQMLFSCYQICCPPRIHRSAVLCILTILASVLPKYTCWAGGSCLSLPVCLFLCVYMSSKMGIWSWNVFSVLPLPFFFLFAKPFFSSHSSYLWQSMLKQSAPCHILGGKWHWYCTKCKKRLSPCENCLIDVKANNFKELWWLQIGSERAIPVHSASHRGCALQFKQQHFGIQSFFITQTNQISNLCDLDAWQ